MVILSRPVTKKEVALSLEANPGLHALDLSSSGLLNRE